MLIKKDKNTIKTKIQNWLELSEMIEIIDSIERNLRAESSIHEARITALELAQAMTESRLYNSLKSKNITTKNKEQKNKPNKEPNKKPKVNAFKVSKKDFKEAFGKGFSKIKTNKKRGRPTKSI